MREIRGGLADPLLLELVDHVVLAGLTRTARLAEADLRAGELLHLDRHVLEHVPEPRPLVLREAPHEPPRLAVRAGVRVERGQRGEQALVEAIELAGRPVLERAEIDGQPHDREQRVLVRTAIDAAFEDLH